MDNQGQRNIKKIYALATRAEMSSGLIWYKEARKLSVKSSNDLKLPLHVFVGVLSALSPRNMWSRNAIDAKVLCSAFLNGDTQESVRVSTYNNMKAKAWKILELMPSRRSIIKILNGLKIVSFFKCIMGDNACCIDGHSYHIWHGQRVVKKKIGKRLLASIVKDYEQVATILGIEIYQLQAITWLTWRRLQVG